MNDHLPNDDEEFVGLTRQQIQDRMERDDEWLKEAERLLMDFGYKYAYVGDDTMPRAKAALLDHLRARPAVEPAALDEDSPMPKHWSVTVEKDGESHLTLSHNHYCGEPDLDEALIVGAAKHLLSFVGYGLPRSTFDPDADEQQVEPAAPVAEQEPVYANASALDWLATRGKNAAVQGFLRNSPDKGCSTPLYAHPAEVSQDRPTDEQTDEIIGRLYRRFREWSRRGFGPEDVTWCEVRADILAMIAIRGETGGSDE